MAKKRVKTNKKKGSRKELIIVSIIALISLALVSLSIHQYTQPTTPSKNLGSELGTISPWAEEDVSERIILSTEERNLYFLDSINSARATISKNELPTILADGTFTSLEGTEYDYTQSIVIGETVSRFGTSGGDLLDPELYLDVGSTSTDPLYNYTISFSSSLNISDPNVQGQEIKILDKTYTIGAKSDNHTLYLYENGAGVYLETGETKIFSIGGHEHEIELVTISSQTTASIIIDGVLRNIAEGSYYEISEKVIIFVETITPPESEGDTGSLELTTGTKILRIQNGATVKSGTDETSIKGTKATISAAGHGLISGFTIQIAMKSSKEDHIAKGYAFTEEVFNALSVGFQGGIPSLNDASRARVFIDTDNNQYAYVTFTSARAGSAGEQRLTYTYDNSTSSSTIQPLLAHQTITASNRGHIHVLEGEDAMEGDWIIVNQRDAGTLLEVLDMSVDTATSGYVTFQDVITGDEQKITLTNYSGTYERTGVYMYGGGPYKIRINSAGTKANITWNDELNVAVFPRIKLKDGGWIAFLTETTIKSWSAIFPDGQDTVTGTGILMSPLETSFPNHGITWIGKDNGGSVQIYGIDVDNDGISECDFSSEKGPAILFIEPKKWDDEKYGDFICIPMTTVGSTEIGIDDPVFSGENSGFVTLSSNVYEKQAVDKYGSLIIKEDRSYENGMVTIFYPSSQMYLGLYLSQGRQGPDPGIRSFQPFYESRIINEEAKIPVTITNYGIENATNVYVYLQKVVYDEEWEVDYELIGSVLISEIETREEREINFTYTPTELGPIELYINISSDEDTNNANNQRYSYI